MSLFRKQLKGFTLFEWCRIFCLLTIISPLWIPYLLFGFMAMSVGSLLTWWSIRNIAKGEIIQAWERCSAVWRDKGEPNDWRGGLQRPFYTPSFSYRLGLYFAKRYYNSSEFVISKTQSKDQFTVLCAIDILHMMTGHDQKLASRLALSELLPDENVLTVLNDEAKRVTRGLGEPVPRITSLGSYFSYSLGHKLGMEFIEYERGEDGDVLREHYCIHYNGQPIPVLPWGDAEFDCILVVFDNSQTKSIGPIFAEQIVRQNIDWVSTTGPDAKWLHDLVDHESVLAGNQEKVGDGFPMTSWFENAITMEQLVDQVRLGIGGNDYFLSFFVGDIEHYHIFIEKLADEVLLSNKT